MRVIDTVRENTEQRPPSPDTDEGKEEENPEQASPNEAQNERRAQQALLGRQTARVLDGGSGDDETPSDAHEKPPSDSQPAPPPSRAAGGGGSKEPPGDDPSPEGAADDEGDSEDDEAQEARETREYTEDIPLHEAVSAPEGFRAQLSNDAYTTEGAGVFEGEEVPYADTGSEWLARRVNNVATERAASLDEAAGEPTEHHFYELGSGTGLLSRHMLDDLKHNHPDLYERTTVHLTDSSEGTVTALQESGIFDEHAGRVKFEVVNAVEPEFPEDARPTMVYHTYLGDSLPTRKITMMDGEIYEKQVRATLPGNAKVIDVTENNDVEVLEAEQIKQVIDDPDPAKRVQLGPQLTREVEEVWTLVPLDEAGFSSEEKARIEELAESTSGFGTFNYSQGLEQSLKASAEGVREGGIVLIADYGLTDPESPASIAREEFGSVTSDHISFFTLRSLEVGSNVHTSTAATPEGETRPILLDTSRDPELRQQTQSTFHDGMDYMNHQLLNQVKGRAVGHIQDGTIHALPRLIRALPEDHQQNMGILGTIAEASLRKGYHGEAIHYAQQMIAEAPHVAASAYRVIADANMAMGQAGNLHEAEACLQKAATIAPHSALVYASQAKLSLMRGDARAYLEAGMNYVRHTPSYNHFGALANIATNLERLGDTATATKIRRQAKKAARKIGKHRLHPDEWSAATHR